MPRPDECPRIVLWAAILYSLVESAKASGIDPIAYLTEVATRAKVSPGAVLLPADFVAERAAPSDTRSSEAPGSNS